MSGLQSVNKREVVWEKWEDAPQTFADSELALPGSVAAMTAVGVVPVYDGAGPSSVFNMWIGHTNFTITPSVVNAIANEPGVEGVDVISRYRFRLVVGKVFLENVVKRGVEQSLRGLAGGISLCLDFLHEYVSGCYWALVKTRDGSCIYVEDGSLVGIQNRITEFPEVDSIYTSWGYSCE